MTDYTVLIDTKDPIEVELYRVMLDEAGIVVEVLPTTSYWLTNMSGRVAPWYRLAVRTSDLEQARVLLADYRQGVEAGRFLEPGEVLSDTKERPMGMLARAHRTGVWVLLALGILLLLFFLWNGLQNR
jgi:hypothetical protein